MPAVRLSDVARAAGVSQATASRVLNGSRRTPGEDVAERVRRAAARLGYVANAQAQALARSSTGLLGLVVHDIADPYFSSIVRGVQNAARQSGAQVLLASTDRDPELERAALGAFISYRTEAIVLTGSRRVSGTREEEELVRDVLRHVENGGRVGVVGQPLDGLHAVVPRNHDGAEQLARALVAAGHRRFAVLAGPPDLQTAVDRCAGFLAGLAAEGVEPELVRGCEFTRDGGFDTAQEMIAQGWVDAGRTGPLCVFAVNDVMALGAIAACRAGGVEVPEQVAVAGFDDIPTLRDHTPGLTTVHLPLQQMGEQITRLVMGHDLPEVLEVPGEVVLRDSTRRSRPHPS